jgi:Gly-Xaa carboxypeptidase
MALVFLLITFSEPFIRHAVPSFGAERPVDKDTEDWCILPESPASFADGLRSSLEHIDHTALDVQVQRLAAAVGVPTVSYDDFGDVNSDPRYKTFDTLHGVLESLFPLMYVKTSV